MSKASKDVGTIPTKASRFTVSRKIDQSGRDAETKHAHHVGEIIHAWNCAHAACFQLFERIAADDDHELAIGLWHTIHNDKTQRQMLKAAVIAKMAKRKSYRSAILWGIGKMNELSTYRNDAAHAEMLYYYDALIPGISNRKPVARRLEQRPLEAHWRKLKGDLHAVAHYLQIVYFSLWYEMPRSLCRRPRLQVACSTSAQTQAKRHRAKKATRERQRQASQE